MKIAHVRERNAPAGSSVAPGCRARRQRPRVGSTSRRRARLWSSTIPAARHNSGALPPADHDAGRPPGARPARRGARARSSRATRGRRRRRGHPGRFGPGLRTADPAPADLPRLLRLRAPRRHDVEAARHGDPRGLVPAADLLLQQRVGDPRARRAGVGAAGIAASSTTSWRWRHSSTRRCATSTRRAARRRSAATWSSTTGARATCSARRRPCGSGPAKGKDFASSIGPWLVTPDELADARTATGYDLCDDRHRQRHRALARHLVLRALQLRRDGRAGLRRRPAAARRPARLWHRRHRLPARDPRRDPEALPRAGRHGHAGDRAPRRADARRSWSARSR